MLKRLLKQNEGFTLIEIVLVLAIAGLILLIVFLAVSGAQKARRDTQRKNDNARLLAAVESCASNNNGDYTSAACSNGASYVTGGAYAVNSFVDPLANANYTVKVGALPACSVPTASTPAVATINIVGRQVTVRMCLEQAYQDLKNF